MDPCRRAKLLTSILNIQILISSIQTFFENLVYLDSCAKVIKGLLNSRFRLTVKQFFQAAFSDPIDYFVKEVKGVFHIKHSGSDDTLMYSVMCVNSWCLESKVRLLLFCYDSAHGFSCCRVLA